MKISEKNSEKKVFGHFLATFSILFPSGHLGHSRDEEKTLSLQETDYSLKCTDVGLNPCECCKRGHITIRMHTVHGLTEGSLQQCGRGDIDREQINLRVAGSLSEKAESSSPHCSSTRPEEAKVIWPDIYVSMALLQILRKLLKI